MTTLQNNVESTNGAKLSASDQLAASNTIGAAAPSLNKNASSLAPDETPLGDGLSCTTGGGSPIHFTGKERDAETGFDYFGARYCASGMGRWLTPDWSAIPAPVPYASLENPQSLNIYAYVGNNPVNRTDPDGHADNDARGCGNASAFCSDQIAYQQVEKAKRAKIQYSLSLPGHDVDITSYASSVDAAIPSMNKLTVAITWINMHSKGLSASAKTIIERLDKITVDNTNAEGERLPTTIDPANGVFNIRSEYIAGSNTAWLASAIAHDAFHIEQFFVRGERNTRENSGRLEHEANEFQKSLGPALGLTQNEMKFLEKDTHTSYNTAPY